MPLSLHIKTLIPAGLLWLAIMTIAACVGFFMVMQRAIHGRNYRRFVAYLAMLSAGAGLWTSRTLWPQLLDSSLDQFITLLTLWLLALLLVSVAVSVSFRLFVNPTRKTSHGKHFHLSSMLSMQFLESSKVPSPELDSKDWVAEESHIRHPQGKD